MDVIKDIIDIRMPDKPKASLPSHIHLPQPTRERVMNEASVMALLAGLAIVAIFVVAVLALVIARGLR